MITSSRLRKRYHLNFCCTRVTPGYAIQVALDSNYDWEATSGFLIGFNLVGTAQLEWPDFPEMNNKFVALMSFERSQFYDDYEDAVSLAVSMTVIGVLSAGILIQKAMKKIMDVLPFEQQEYDLQEVWWSL